MGEHQVGIERPKGSRNADLQQDAATLALLVLGPPGVPLAVDVTDRWARLLGQVDIARANGAAMAAANPLIAGIYDAAGNRMPSMDAVARPGFVDVIDRAARLLGTVSPVAGSVWDVSDRAARLLGKIYGDTGLLAQRALTLDAYVQLRSAGVEIDPRSIRALINTDVLGVVNAAGDRMPSMDTVGRAGYHYLTDGTRTAEIDIVEGAQVRIDLAHHMIHDGKGYTCDDYATGLGAGASKYWHFKAPNTAARIHINATIFATDAGIAYFYELPTTTANGTALTPRNNDRNNANASVLSVWKDPTVTADGTQLGVSALGTNNPKTRFGGEAKQNFEWILKQNIAYLLKFTADNAGTAVNLGLEYYEA